MNTLIGRRHLALVDAHVALAVQCRYRHVAVHDELQMQLAAARIQFRCRRMPFFTRAPVVASWLSVA